MSLYSKEFFTGPVGGTPTPNAPTVATQTCESTTCSNQDASNCINSAVIVTMIEGYIAFRAKNRTLTNLNEALDLVSTMTKDMIDNGDITACQLENIKTWIKEKSSMFVNNVECCKHKLVHKVLDNCGFTCNGSTECGPETTIGKYLHAHDELHRAERAVIDELGPSIQSSISQFINRYGRLMDETYLKEWN